MADIIEIRDVWEYNLDQEFNEIRGIVENYKVVAMDTEYPGVVFQRSNNEKDQKDHTYGILQQNVNALKLIQLGLTFADKDGNLATCVNEVDKSVKKCVWQFNFKEFNENIDECAKKSIAMLKESGIDFDKNMRMGVDVKRFGELLMTSGVVLDGDICWVTFHGGYDLGYLLRLLTQKDLDISREKFFDLIKIFFPTIYDVKHLMRQTSDLHGGLRTLAERLEVARVGVAHQAGSDSLLTSQCFKKMIDTYFANVSIEAYAGVLYGLNDP